MVLSSIVDPNMLIIDLEVVNLKGQTTSKILDLMQYKAIQFGMVYVDFTKLTTGNHISYNFSFNIDFF